MLDEARASLSGFSAEPGRMGAIYNARAVICLAEGDPATALDVLRDVRDATLPSVPASTLVEAHLLAGLAQLDLGDRKAAAAAAEAALAAAEPDRLMFPFAITGAAELLDTATPSRNGSSRSSLRRRGPAARRAGSEPRSRAPTTTRRAQPERAPGAAVSADKPDAARHGARALRLGQHRQHAHPQHLFQARCARSLLCRQARSGAAASVNRALRKDPDAASEPQECRDHRRRPGRSRKPQARASSCSR